MAYSNVTSRTDAAALIPEDVASEILKGTTEKSAALTLFRKRSMGTAQTRMPVLAAKPAAYWITGASLDERDTGRKQTTELAWGNVYLNAEELAVIVPIPQNVLDDVDYDLWAEAKPEIEEAIAVKVDEAVFFGIDKPASWPTALVTAAASAGNVVTAGTSTVDVVDDINDVMAAVEADGFDVDGFWARIQMKARLRGLRDSQKQFLLQGDGNSRTLFGERVVFNRAGLSGFSTDAANYSLIAGDWNAGIMGVRKDITFEIFKEGVIQDAAGNIVWNLMQNDMKAMRVTARFAWAVANPINRSQTTEADRYPFAALKQKASTGGE